MMDAAFKPEGEGTMRRVSMRNQQGLVGLKINGCCDRRI